MKRKKIIISFLLVLLVIMLICLMFFFVKAKEFKNSIIQTSLEKFVPFYEGNILPRYDVNFRVTDNSLKIEAASAFYPFAATIVQNIYDRGSYSKDTLKLV